MGLTPYLGIERGNIACHKSEARFGTLLREGRLASRAFRDEAFWQSQVNFGPPNPATDEKALWSKGKRVVTLPAFQRCLEDGPDAAERRPGSGFPTGRGETAISRRITTYRQHRRDLEGNPIGSQRIHSTRSLPDFIFIIFWGEGISFLQRKKNGADLTRHNLTIHPIPMICV
ncbi:UNVERIFIED_CONTAM: putative mitochondrial protein [Sesamum latifolium]|uniref:Mitochondrial protein n=1 Tax=Sesamum latifolium TaxID=2727402 RepID=A0AAW2S2K7_9LAMI